MAFVPLRPRHANDEIYLGQCSDLPGWNSLALRLWPHTHQLESTLHTRGNAGGRGFFSMACPGAHRATRESFQTNNRVQARRRFCVRDACCGSVHRPGSVPRLDERLGCHSDRQGGEARKTRGRRAARTYCGNVDVHQAVLVCGPEKAANYGRSSHGLGRVRQRVRCCIFLVTSAD